MIVCEKAGLTYTAIPKNACTSMKCFFYHINTGDDFAEVSPKKKMGYQGIHHVDGYRMGKFNPAAYDNNKDKEHAAIIRDPLDRFKSAFKNRLFQFNDIRSRPQATEKSAELGLNDQPTFAYFIDRLEDYLRASNVIRFHLRPAHFFLGDDLSIFHHIIPLEQTESLCELVRERSGMDVNTVRANESHSAQKPDYHLNESQFNKLNTYLSSDYSFLGDYYSPRKYDKLPDEMKMI
ncbi:sulfotransferase family 2 domain-containing protein [Paracoccus aestuariivivens]|uniref:Sulfotransferase family 2 domain-containing protein n=1 Tax=Paracoccus aestuariivivens TaxID=1820333 RepID=A0A6L6JJ93_9RHOB|nr:sulfotransferase family 2 domain-containing protein [Paracoccus aestuariivivens]MTH80214.1 hypothetical protein [Paracoccus aestuariivivens]